MLNKLLKHEFKATSRYIIPLYLILLVVSLLDRIVLSLDIFTGALQIIPGLLTLAYVVSVIGVIAATFILMIMRFYKNLMSDEGYLMFTLPVNPDRLIISKLVVSVIWILASVAAVIASLFLVFATPGNMQSFWQIVDKIINELAVVFNDRSALLIIEFCVMLLISIVQNILMIYTSIAVGHLFNGHKLAGSLIAYVCISIAVQIAVTAILLIGGHFFHRAFDEMDSILDIVFPAGIVISLILSTAYFFTTNKIFKRRLNLE